MAKRNVDIEKYVVLDPRIKLLNELRNAQWPVPVAPQKSGKSPESARREAQWPTWQMDRSWGDRSPVRMSIVPVSVLKARHDSFPWILSAAALLALGVVAAGLLTVGIETGLL